MTSTAQALLARLDLVIDRSPDSPSVVIDGLVAHTYRSLDRRARALADEWTHRGLQSGDLVALVLGHHADHIAGMLAAWRCNAAFLPLDPALPKARTESILTHSQAAWALDTSGTRRLNDAPRRYLNAHGKAAAYVVYTSGSTGTPKGVIVGHDGLLDMLASQIDAFALDADSRAVWLLSASFDASISDIGTALLSGAQLHTSQHDLLRNPSELVSFVDAQQITHADLPPALLRVLSPTSFADSLRTLIVGGEPSPPEVIRQWASRRRIINVYGPTEATVCTSLCECDATTWQRPILGHPTRGVTYEVVDPDGKDIAEQPGELIISGPCVAWGYVDESTRSSSHFFERNGTRSYRTGDRVIAHANGELEFVGRVDRQLKLHGLRIEPAEIENAMSALDGVTSAIALLVRARDDDSELVVAYEGAQRDSRQLRQELSKVLPRWIQPSRLIWMEALPRSVSGKIDIRRVETLVGRRQSVSCDSFFEMLRSLVSHADLTREHALNELAIDSFSALRLLAWAHSNNLPLRIDDLSSHRSIRDIEKMLSERTGQDRIASTRRTCEELRARVMSDAGFCRLETTRPQAALDSKREVVFLTGAAGFLGAHTLAELLEDPALHIRALVRAHDRSHARAKIAARLRRHGRVLSEEQWSRVDLWCGDLAEPRFGLGERWFDCATNVRMYRLLGSKGELDGIAR
ncbi:MAG: AMP-binding protein [Polyangiaceae bacterium]